MDMWICDMDIMHTHHLSFFEMVGEVVIKLPPVADRTIHHLIIYYNKSIVIQSYTRSSSYMHEFIDSTTVKKIKRLRVSRYLDSTSEVQAKRLTHNLHLNNDRSVDSNTP